MEITEEVGKDAEGENPEEMMESDDKQNEAESMFSLVYYYYLLRSSDDLYQGSYRFFRLLRRSLEIKKFPRTTQNALNKWNTP